MLLPSCSVRRSLASEGREESCAEDCVASMLPVQKPSRRMTPAAAWMLTLAVSLALQVALSAHTHGQSGAPSSRAPQCSSSFRNWIHCFVNPSDIQRGIFGSCTCTARRPVRMHAHMHTHARTHTHTRTHARWHARTHAHTPTHKHTHTFCSPSV